MKQTKHEAQIEVWEWKETLYKELKKIPRELWAKYLNDKAKDTIQNLEELKKVKLQAV